MDDTPMDSAVDRLAVELMKLPAGEWERVAALQSGQNDSDANSSDTTGQQNQAGNDPVARVGAGETA